MGITRFIENWYEKIPRFNRGMCFTNNFFKDLEIKKSRIAFSCVICGKKKTKKSRYIGGNWEKVCQGCMKEWFEKTIPSLENLKKICEDSIKEVEENKTKWDEEVLIEAI